MPKSKLTIYIDDREKRSLEKPLAKFKRLQARVKWRRMEAGDIRFIHKNADGDRRVLVAIERKAANDLLNSVESGIFYKQKRRLLEESPPVLLYLVEGKPSRFMETRWQRRGGAVVNVERVCNAMMRDDGIRVLRTENPRRTIRELEKWEEKLTKENDASVSDGKAEVGAPLFGIKCEEMTSEQLLRGTLAAIPGVRHALAADLAKEYRTISNFITSSTADTLEGTPYSCGASDKKCRLGKVVAKRMESLLDL